MNTKAPTTRISTREWVKLNLRPMHRFSAAILGTFVLLHIANHIAGFAGQGAHRSVQLALRWLYQGWLEPVLLISCIVQVTTGLRMVWQLRKGLRRNWLQPVSGIYLAVFLSIHVFVVMQARMHRIETDLAFAAAGMHAGNWWLFFTPYYGLAIVALGLHISVPIGRHRPVLARAVICVSVMLALALICLLAGLITPLSISPELIRAFPRW